MKIETKFAYLIFTNAKKNQSRRKIFGFETEAFIKVRKCTYIYIYMNINKGYHPMKFEGSGSEGTCVIERKQF